MESMVSIIVLCYNHEKYVKSCIDSILSQSYDNIEVIIIDNNSSDRSREIIEENIETLKMKFSRVVYECNNTNVGIPKAFNQGVKIARGDYIKEIASDDFLTSDSIEKLVAFFMKNESYAFIVGNGYIVNQDACFDKTSVYTGNKMLYETVPDFSGDYFNRLIMRDNIAAPAVMIKKDSFIKYGFYDEDLPFEDWDFWLNIISKSGTCGFCNILVVYYRKNINSATTFSKEDKDLENKFLRYYTNNKMIFAKYMHLLEPSIKQEIQNKIFEKYFDWAINLNLRKSLLLVFKDGIEEKSKISMRNRVRYLLSITNLYELQKKIRRLIHFSEKEKNYENREI